MKLIDQWNELQTLIEKKEQEFIAEQRGLPTEFYEVYPNGQLNVKPVIKVVHSNFSQYVNFVGKRPSREDLQKLQNKYYTLVLDEKYLRFRYDQYNSYGMDQVDNKRLFIDRSLAEAKAKELTDRIAEEERLLSGGDHDRCQRCRKVVPKAQILNSTIIGRSRNAFGKAIVTQTPMKFCSGECAGCEQMSREG
jgi:predicted DNA-binding WGR domain protein